MSVAISAGAAVGLAAASWGITRLVYRSGAGAAQAALQAPGLGPAAPAAAPQHSITRVRPAPRTATARKAAPPRAASEAAGPNEGSQGTTVVRGRAALGAAASRAPPANPQRIDRAAPEVNSWTLED